MFSETTFDPKTNQKKKKKTSQKKTRARKQENPFGTPRFDTSPENNRFPLLTLYVYNPHFFSPFSFFLFWASGSVEFVFISLVSDPAVHAYIHKLQKRARGGRG